MGNRVQLSATVLILSLVCSMKLHSFTQNDILSPAEGTWANQQPLVLNTSDGSDLYYSFTSDDPLSSGFMYDGPVVIDGTGAIVLHVTSVAKDGSRSDYVVSYVISPASPNGLGSDGNQFIQNIVASPIQKYVSGTKINIPSELLYSLGSDTFPSVHGASLTLSAKNKLERYLPCSVSDGGHIWRFVIHTVAADSELISGSPVPFTIDDWTTFSFTGDKLIYQIDDAYWSASKNTVELDRSVAHTVRWQSVSYEFGNPVEEFVLPAKPALLSRKDDNGVVTFYIAENEVQQKNAKNAKEKKNKFLLAPALERPDSGTLASGLYEEIPVDTFAGDAVGGKMVAGVFYNGVYQGSLSTTYSLDRQPPALPVITSSSAGSYTRSKVTVTITAEDKSTLFYAVSAPLESDVGFEGTDKSVFDAVQPGAFAPYTGMPVLLKSSQDKADFYKVNAYAVDEAGNKSGVAEYRIVVDEYNYYLSTNTDTLSNKTVVAPGTPAVEPDGSYGNPFTTFAQAVKAINAMEFTQLHILGDIVVESGETRITSSCHLVGKNSTITIPQDGYITISNATLNADDCIFEKQVSNKLSRSYVTDEQNALFQKMFICDHAKIGFTNCEIIGVFSFDGILFNGTRSELHFANCGLTVQGDSYACALSTTASSVTAEKVRVTSSAATCVCFSIQGGQFVLSASKCHTIGHIGRIAEFTGAKATVTANTFAGESDDSLQAGTALWKDVDTVLDQSENETSGFSL